MTAAEHEPKVEYTGQGTKEDPFVVHGVELQPGEKQALITHKQLVYAEFALVAILYGPSPPNWQVIAQSLNWSCAGHQCRVLDIRVQDEPLRLWFDETESTVIAHKDLHATGSAE